MIRIGSLITIVNFHLACNGVAHIYKYFSLGIITVSPPVVWPVFTLPTCGLKLYTLPT